MDIGSYCLLGTYHVPGAVLCDYRLFFLMVTAIPYHWSCNHPHFKVRKLRLRMMERLSQVTDGVTTAGTCTQMT